MELRHLRYFVVVAEELHFARAAARLNISPSSLTEQIQTLEASLGGALFKRTNKAVSLTGAGQRFLDEARLTVQHADHAQLVGRRAIRGEIGKIDLGFTVRSTCSGLIQFSLKEFRVSHPHVEFNIHRLNTMDQMQALIEERLDVGFFRPPSRFPMGLTGFVMSDEPFIIALPDDHPLAKIRLLTPQMLANEKFVTPAVELEFTSSGYLDAIAEPGNFQPNIVQRAPDIISALTLVAAGIGLTLIPKSLENLRFPGLIYRPIDLQTPCTLLAVHRKIDRSPAIKAFLTQLRSMRRTPIAART
jgi:DNA-binding transcriptional LysR family regulator